MISISSLPCSYISGYIMIHITISPSPEPNPQNRHPKFNQARCPLGSSEHHHRHKRICRQIRPWSNNPPATASEFIRIAKCPMDLLKNWRYVRQIQGYFVSGIQDPQVSATVVSLFPLFHRRGLVIWPSNVGGGAKEMEGVLRIKRKTSWDTNPMIAAGDKLHESRQRNLNFTAVHLGFLKSESPKSLTFWWFSILFHDFEPWVTIFRRAPKNTIHTFPVFSSTWSKALCRQRILAGTMSAMGFSSRWILSFPRWFHGGWQDGIQ